MTINEIEFRKIHLELLLIARGLIAENTVIKEDIKNARIGIEAIAQQMKNMMVDSDNDSQKENKTYFIEF